MSDKDSSELLLQAAVDNMTRAEADAYVGMLDRRATTERQRTLANRYPIWNALLKQKLTKLDQRAERERQRQRR